MPSLKEFNVKLASLRNTRKMTKTMQMVSASKLRKAQEAQRNAQAYATQLADLMSRLAGAVGSVAHPLLESRANPRQAALLMISSDRGLCAGFNNYLIKDVTRWQAANAERFDDIQMSFCGRRGYNYFRNRAKVLDHYEDSTAKPDFVQAREIGAKLSGMFVSGELDEVYLAYNQFESPLSQIPTITKLLPIEPGEIKQKQGGFSVNYTFEPEQSRLLQRLLPRSVTYKIYHALIENSAGEHGARMTAMDNATSNADSLIETYTLLRNRARQAAITTELTEIVAGAEAL